MLHFVPSILVFSSQCPWRTERTNLTTSTGYPLERTSAFVHTFLLLFVSSSFCESPSTNTACCHTNSLTHTKPRSRTVTQLLLLCNWTWRVMQHFLHAYFVHKFQLTVSLLLRQQLNGKCRYWSVSVSEINKNCCWTCYTFPHFLGPTGTAATFNSALTSLCMESELVYIPEVECCNLWRERGELLFLTL